MNDLNTPESIKAKCLEEFTAEITDAYRRKTIAAVKIQEWQRKLEEGSIHESDCRDRQRPWAEKYKDAKADFERLRKVASNLREMAEDLDVLKKNGVPLEEIVLEGIVL